MKLLNQIHYRAVCCVLMAAGIVFWNGQICNASGKVAFSNNRVILFADNEPLIPLLEEIAKKTNVVVFISKGFNPGNISVRVDNLPLEKALKKILKGFNTAMVYHKKQDRIRLTAVKVYPEGKTSGPMNVVIRSSVPAIGQTVSHADKRYSKHKTDILSAGEYVNTVEYDTLVTKALEFEQKEKNVWKEIQALEKRVNNESDKTKNDVLSMALLDKYESFESMQENHINILENMHRVEHFMKSKSKKNDEIQN